MQAIRTDVPVEFGERTRVEIHRVDVEMERRCGMNSAGQAGQRSNQA